MQVACLVSVKAVLSFRLKLVSISFRFLFYLIEQNWVISYSCLQRTTRRCTKFWDMCRAVVLRIKISILPLSCFHCFHSWFIFLFTESNWQAATRHSWQRSWYLQCCVKLLCWSYLLGQGWWTSWLPRCDVSLEQLYNVKKTT